jgi:hypothetical protein
MDPIIFQQFPHQPEISLRPAIAAACTIIPAFGVAITLLCFTDQEILAFLKWVLLM